MSNWNLNINNEREYIKKYIIGAFIPKPETCENCKIGTIDYKNLESLNNPL